MSNKTIENMSLDLALKVTKMCQVLRDEGRKEIVAERLLDSCVSVGVFIHDYEYAKDKSETNKSLNSALSELKYTTYWLDLMYETGLINYDVYDKLLSEFVDFNKDIKEMIELMNFSKS